MKLEIIDNSNALHTFNRAAFLTLASSIEKHEKHEFNYVNIIFSADENMRLLKQQYFNQDYYTDAVSYTHLTLPTTPYV